MARGARGFVELGGQAGAIANPEAEHALAFLPRIRLMAAERRQAFQHGLERRLVGARPERADLVAERVGHVRRGAEGLLQELMGLAMALRRVERRHAVAGLE